MISAERALGVLACARSLGRAVEAGFSSGPASARRQQFDGCGDRSCSTSFMPPKRPKSRLLASPRRHSQGGQTPPEPAKSRRRSGRAFIAVGSASGRFVAPSVRGFRA
jgi:hypothetical protein